jgi:hypothetical protein
MDKLNLTKEQVEKAILYGTIPFGLKDDWLSMHTEIERLEKQAKGLAQSAMNNGQDLLLKEAELTRLHTAIEEAMGEIKVIMLNTPSNEDSSAFSTALDILRKHGLGGEK